MGMTAQLIPMPQGVKSRKSAGHEQAPKRRRRKIRHFTEAEVQTLTAAAKKVSRNPHRDATMILIAYRHGLRVSELVDLAWDRIYLDQASLWVERAKGSKSGMHPLSGTELRALRKLRRASPGAHYVFLSELGGPLSVDAVQYMLRRAGEAAGFPFRVHPHLLRHACGYYLINLTGSNTRVVQEYLGHVDIKNTELYTEVDTKRFRGFWK